MIEHQHVILFPVKLSMDLRVAKTLAITHLDCASIYISSENEIPIKTHAADAFVSKEHELAPFHTNYFSNQARNFLDSFYGL